MPPAPHIRRAEPRDASALAQLFGDVAMLPFTTVAPHNGILHWEKRLAGFLTLWDREVLQDAGKVSAEIAKAHAESEFEKYRIVQDRLFVSDFDRLLKS